MYVHTSLKCGVSSYRPGDPPGGVRASGRLGILGDGSKGDRDPPGGVKILNQKDRGSGS